MADLVDWGILAHNENKQQCLRHADNLCTPFLSNKHVNDQFTQLCKGRANCTLTNFDEFISKGYKASDRESVAQCYQPTSRLFFQYMCKQTNSEIAHKQHMAGYNIDIEIMTGVLLLAFLIIAKIATKQLSSRWDDNNVTPSDYTLYFTLDSEIS